MNNIYKKYCNEIQNPALGATLICIFSKAYKENSLSKNNPSILLIFLIMPLILNKDFRNLVIKDDGKRASNNINSFLSKINENIKTFESLHDYIKIFRGYTLTSLIFALKTGLIEVEENMSVASATEGVLNFPEKNIYIKTARILGEYFSNGISLQLLTNKIGVIF